MGFIVRWLADWLMEGFVGVFELVSAVSKDCFDNRIVTALLTVFQTIGLPLIGLSIMVLLLKTILDASDGKEVAFMDTMKRCVGGIIVYTFGVNIMKNLYLVILDVCSKIIKAIIGLNDIEVNLQLLAIDAVNALVGLIMIIVMIYYMFKTFLDLTERFWQILVLLCMLYIYVPGYVSGNDESITIWFKQTLGVMLTQVFQTVLIVTGITIYVSSGSVGELFLAIGAMVAASKVEQLLDRYGMGAGGKLGALARNGMSVAFYSKSIFRKA